MPYNRSGFSFDLVLPSLKLTDKKQVLQTIAEETSKIIGIREKLLYSRLAKIDSAQNANAEEGVLLLDLKVSAMTQSFMVLAPLEKPVNFGAGNYAIDLVCVLLSPEHEDIQHLQKLASWSRLLHNSSFCEGLRSANDEDDVRMTLRSVNSRMRAA